MENEQYILKYRQKSMIYLAYFSLGLFTLLLFLNRVEYHNVSTFIFSKIFTFSWGIVIFYVANFMYNRKVIISEKGIIIKKFLQKSLFIDWNIIEKICFRCQGYSSSEIAGMGTCGPVIYLLNRNLKNVGRWTVSIKSIKKNHKINLYIISFSSINEINPLIYRYSQLKYLTFKNLQNKKRRDIVWTWKLEGSEEERKETLTLMEENEEYLKKKLKGN